MLSGFFKRLGFLLFEGNSFPDPYLAGNNAYWYGDAWHSCPFGSIEEIQRWRAGFEAGLNGDRGNRALPQRT